MKGDFSGQPIFHFIYLINLIGKNDGVQNLPSSICLCQIMVAKRTEEIIFHAECD